MFISPKKAIENNWIRFPYWMSPDFQDKCIQPNAIDFTLDRVFVNDYFSNFVISESKKIMRASKEIAPYLEANLDGELGWMFQEGNTYDCLSDFYVDLPSGVAAMMVTRSTFVRNGLFWISGLFDTGFKGHIGGVVHTDHAHASVAKGTRIGQIIFIASDSAGMYAGGWNHAEGTHYKEGK